jgi:hypothetical protein
LLDNLKEKENMKLNTKLLAIVLVAVLILVGASTTLQTSPQTQREKPITDEGGPYEIPSNGDLVVDYTPSEREEYVIPNFPFYENSPGPENDLGLTPCSVAAILKYYDNTRGSNYIPSGIVFPYVFSDEYISDYYFPIDYQGHLEFDNSWPYDNPHEPSPDNCIASFLHTSRMYDRNWAGMTDWWFAFGEEPSSLPEYIESYASWAGYHLDVTAYDYATYGAFKTIIDSGNPVLVAFGMHWWGIEFAPTLVVPVFGYRHDLLFGDQICFYSQPDGEILWTTIQEGGWSLFRGIGQVYTFDVPDSWPSKISIKFPVGGEDWMQGATKNLAWYSTNCGPNVKIELLNCWGDTRFKWTVQSSYPNGDGLNTLPYLQQHDEKNYGYMFQITDLSNPEVKCVGGLFSVTPVDAGGDDVQRETWEKGTSHLLTWDTVSRVTNVKLVLSSEDNPDYSYVIKESYPNTKSYEWLIPLEIPEGNYKIFVRDLGSIEGEGWDFTDQVFTIVERPSATVTDPVSTDVWKRRTTETISWTSTGNWPRALVEVCHGDTCHGSMVDNTGSTTVYIDRNWVISDDYKIKVTPCQQEFIPIPGALVGESGVFSVTWGGLDLDVLIPNLYGSYKIGSTLKIQWGSGYVGTVKIDLYKGTTLSKTVVTNLASKVGTNTYNWVIPSNTAVASTYKIKITDTKDSNVKDMSDYSFSITR